MTIEGGSWYVIGLTIVIGLFALVFLISMLRHIEQRDRIKAADSALRDPELPLELKFRILSELIEEVPRRKAIKGRGLEGTTLAVLNNPGLDREQKFELLNRLFTTFGAQEILEVEFKDVAEKTTSS